MDHFYKIDKINMAGTLTLFELRFLCFQAY